MVKGCASCKKVPAIAVGMSLIDVLEAYLRLDDWGVEDIPDIPVSELMTQEQIDEAISRVYG